MTLYRTYRPDTFAELIGQESVTRTLQQALIQGRVTHAYLFTGPRGTGKTSAARIFTRALVCQNPVTKKEGSYEPCNACDNCRSVLENHTPDVIEIDAASNRGIEDIRDVREQVQYPPTHLPRKIYIVDEVHMLTTEAFNALLKTLEEPPEYCIFLLATTELHKVPLTIRSRCQALRLSRGSMHSIIQKLKHVAKAEKIDVEADAIELIARHAEGGFRDAETLLESLSTQHSPLTAADVRDVLGVISSDEIEALLAACFSGDEKTTRSRLAQTLKDWHGSADGLTSQLIEAVRGHLYKDSAAYPADRARFALAQLMEAYILQRHSPVPTLPLELACMEICAFGSPLQVVQPPAAAPAAPSRVTAHIVATPKEPAPAPQAVVPPPAPETPASVPVVEIREDPEHLKDLRKAWKACIAQVCKENLPLGQALKEAVFHDAQNGVITIHVRYKFHVDRMNDLKSRSLIGGIMETLTGEKWEITYLVSNTLPKKPSLKAVDSGLSETAASVFGSTS